MGNCRLAAGPTRLARPEWVRITQSPREAYSHVHATGLNGGIRAGLARPLLASFLISCLFFLGFLSLLHPGYWINDDLKIILNAIGYPAGGHVPFLIHTNVLIGFLLLPLYALPTSLNWEILLFVVINACSTWAFLYVALSSESRPGRWFGTALILACSLFLLLDITYTVTAAWASVAGMTLLLASAWQSTARWGWRAASGIALILIGSMIRIQSVLPVLGFAAPAFLLLAWRGERRRLAAGIVVGALAIGACYGFDRLYVRGFPDWNAYYRYNATRELLHDTHRLENAGTQIHRIGWSGNDQELFARWFFPDRGLYSLDHLRYLVDRLPATAQDVPGLLSAFFATLLAWPAIICLVLMLAVLLSGIWRRSPPRNLLAVCVIWAIAILENLVLAWAYKDPDYLLLSTLIGSTILGFSLLGFPRQDRPTGAHSPRAFLAASILALAVGIALVVYHSIGLSQDNARKELTYRQAISDLAQLRTSGQIADNALIISPAHGLPLEWSNPFTLDLPSVAYYDTGWITFSPSYERVLQAFHVASLPDALVENDNVYLMTRGRFTPFLARYYQEHAGFSVAFDSIYTMPNSYGFSGYDDIHLYKVTRLR